MTDNGWWVAGLAVAAGGALALSVTAAALNRRIAELHRAMRPLRTANRRRAL
jgi:hypothetical protein